MEYKTVILEVFQENIAILRLNRPSNLNSFNIDLMSEISEACSVISKDSRIRVLVITGEGRGFSAGGDVSLLQSIESDADAEAIFNLSTEAVKSVYMLEIPVICAVNGPVAGASLALMSACDMIIAADTAKFGFTFINMAFCPDSGCSYFLTQKVGYHKAMELLCFGRVISAEEAYGLNLVNLIVQRDKVLEVALNWAATIAQGPFQTIKMDKKILRRAVCHDFYSQAALECAYQTKAWKSEDFREGTLAFLEKRKPVFKGR